MTARSRPAAADPCDLCIRRAHVFATLAARIEGLLQKPSSRIANLLALSNDELIDALVPADRMGEVADAIAGFRPDSARIDAAAAALEMLCRHSPGYPNALRELPDSPPILWVRGGVDRLSSLL